MLATRQHCPILPARQHWPMLSSGGVALVSQCCLLDNIGCVPLPGQPLWPRRYPVILPSPNGIHYQAIMLLLPPPKQGEERTLTNIALGPTALGQYQSMFSPHPVLGGVIRALQPSNVSHLGWVILLDIAQARAAIQAKGHIQYCLVGSIDLPRPFHRQTILTNVAQQATLVNVVQQVTLLLKPQDDIS